MSKLKIVPVADVSSWKTGSIFGLTKADIDRILGFKPNGLRDEYKSEYGWEFNINGSDCAIWDWKGSHKLSQWSAYGPDHLLREVFGSHYSSGG